MNNASTVVGGGEQMPVVVSRKRLSEELEPVSHVINVDAVFGVGRPVFHCSRNRFLCRCPHMVAAKS